MKELGKQATVWFCNSCLTQERERERLCKWVSAWRKREREYVILQLLVSSENDLSFFFSRFTQKQFYNRENIPFTSLYSVFKSISCIQTSACRIMDLLLFPSLALHDYPTSSVRTGWQSGPSLKVSFISQGFYGKQCFCSWGSLMFLLKRREDVQNVVWGLFFPIMPAWSCKCGMKPCYLPVYFWKYIM